MALIECGMGASALFGWIGGMVPKQRNPSRIQAQGATNSFADTAPNGSFETAKSKAKPMALIECGMGASALFGWIGGMVPKQRNPSRIQAQGATNSFADMVPNGSFETAKSKAKPMAWIECGMEASALFGWIGGMEQRNPSRIEAQGATNSFADVVPNGSFETAKSKAKPMVWIEPGMGASALFGWIGGMVPKQRNPSRIEARGATNSFADVVPNGSFETAKSKAKPMAWIECGMGASAFFGWIGGMEQRNPSRIQAQGATNSFADVVPNGSFETAKSKAKPMAWIECGMGASAFYWLDWRHGSEIAEPQQDSSPRGHEFVRRRGAERQLRNR